MGRGGPPECFARRTVPWGEASLVATKLVAVCSAAMVSYTVKLFKFSWKVNWLQLCGKPLPNGLCLTAFVFSSYVCF